MSSPGRDDRPALDRWLAVEKGRVEVVRASNGGPEVRLATLGPGEYFGEVALLRDLARTATLRALEPTDVFSLGRATSRPSPRT